MIWTALVLGLAGSLHCVAMCGPLMLAVPLPEDTRRRLVWSTGLYQTGRISAYAGLGLFFGLAGKGLALAGFQQGLSVFAGALLVFAAFFSYRWEQLAMTMPGMRQMTQWVKKQLGQLMRKNSIRASYSMGFLNGFLPCGLVYAALAGAIASGGPVEGSLFMALFGIGTSPLLLVSMFAGRRLGSGARRRFQLVQPMLLLITGALLISRGLELDLSLFESAVPPADLDCH